MIVDRRRQTILLATAFLGTLAGSLFWTGFPIAIARKYGGEFSLSFIYMLAIGGALLFDLAGGVFADLKNVKLVAVLSLLTSGALLIVLSYSTSCRPLIFVLLPLIYFNFSLGSVAENVWLLKAATDVQSSFLNRRVASISAKIIGFSFGPIVFALPIGLALGACASLILVCAFTQLLAIPGVQVTHSPHLKDSLQAIKEMFGRPALALLLILTGFLTVPISPLFVEHLALSGDLQSASLFWLFSGVLSLVAVLLLKKYDFISRKHMITLLTLAGALCFALAFALKIQILILVGGPVYVFASVALSASLQSQTIAKLSTKTLGTSLGAIDALVDLGTFIGLAFGAVARENVPLTAITVCFLIVTRGFFQNLLFSKAPQNLGTVGARA